MSYSVNILLSEGGSRKDLNIVYTQKKYTVNKKKEEIYYEGYIFYDHRYEPLPRK